MHIPEQAKSLRTAVLAEATKEALRETPKNNGRPAIAQGNGVSIPPVGQEPSDEKKKKRRAKPPKPDTDFGRMLRCAVRGFSGFSETSMEQVEIYLAGQLGYTKKTVVNFYKGKAPINKGVITKILDFGAACSFLNREWAYALVEAGDYNGDPNVLLDAYPQWRVGTDQSSKRTRHNLPDAKYTHFVMRPALYAEILDRLQLQSPAVVLVGLPGSGKTALASEIARHCFLGNTHPDHPEYEAVVWVSDEETPGETHLGTVLEAIVTTLGASVRNSFDRTEMRKEVDQLLRRHRTLLVLDNFETVSDVTLLNWLRTLPYGSKALITSRVFPAEFENGGPIKIDVGRMSEKETQEFIQLSATVQRLPIPPDAATQRRLFEVTGGNPLAIQMLLGLMRATGRSVDAVLQLESLPANRDINALISEHWERLGATERQLLLALSLFIAGASDDALREVAGLDIPSYIEVIEDLDLAALVETTATESPDGVRTQRRFLHPLVREHVLGHASAHELFLAAARSRRLYWAVSYAERFGGFRPNDPVSLAQLAIDEQNLWDVLTWAAHSGYDEQTVLLGHKLEYYYYTRAQWRRNRELYGFMVAAARRRGDTAEIVNCLALQIQLFSRQGQPGAVQDELSRLAAISRREMLAGEVFFRAHHAQALAHFAGGALREAAAAWQMIDDQAHERGVSPKLVTGTLHWLALCRQRQGEPTEARELMERSLALALEQQNPRRAARNQIALASFALDAGRADEAERWLVEAQTNDPKPDQEQLAHYLLALGRLHALRKETSAARATFKEALPLFERMGMEPEVREVQSRIDAL